MLLLEDKSNFFKTLSVPEEFGYNLDFDDRYMIENFAENEVTNHVLCSYDFGVSKIAFLLKGASYAVKLPFTGQYCYHRGWDDDDDDWAGKESEEGETFDWYSGASCADGCNYCEAELNKYDKLVDLGFGMFVAKTEFGGYTDTATPYYLQELVSPYSYGGRIKATTPPTQKSLDAADKFLEREGGQSFIERNEVARTFTNKFFLADLIEAYGAEKVEEFCHYVQTEDREIADDLHTGNFGYRVSDGSPCILDFSAWNN